MMSSFDLDTMLPPVIENYNEENRATKFDFNKNSNKTDKINRQRLESSENRIREYQSQLKENEKKLHAKLLVNTKISRYK